MKTVILLRHAKSDWSDGVSRDFDRPLNDRGRRAARRIGEWARTEGLHFDVILASPAVRVTETLDEFMESYRTPVDTRWDRRIYLASSATLLDVLRDLPDEVGTALMVGHNPGMEDMVLDLVPDRGDDPLRDQVEEKYPTASVARLEFPVHSWNDAGKPARITLFVRPRDLDPALGPDAHQY